MVKFIFDLDGTITKVETLPFIAKHFNVAAEMENLTRQSVFGDVSFEESFTKRVSLLSHLPVDEVSNLLADVPIFALLQKFIEEHQADCLIATGNLYCWVNQLIPKIGCPCFASKALVEDNKIIKITEILQKDRIVNVYKDCGEKVIYIGDGSNDIEAMRVADVSIASALLHSPSQAILDIADHVVFNEEDLYNLLSKESLINS